MSISRTARKASRSLGPELIWEAALAIALGLAALGILSALVSFHAQEEPPPPNYASSLWSGNTATGAAASTGSTASWTGSAVSSRPSRVAGTTLSTETIAVTVTATGGLRTIIGGSQVVVTLPRDATVAQLSNRLVDNYPALGVPMIHNTGFMGRMFPQNTVLKDGQVVTLGR